MSDESREDAELHRIIRQATRRLDQKSEAERRRLLQQAVEQALAEELAEKRAESEREADVVREELIRDRPQEEALRARRRAPSTILLLLMLLLILLLIATATGRADILRFPGSRLPADTAPTLQPRIEGSGQSGAQIASAGDRAGAAIPAIGSLSAPAPQIDARFRDYYVQHGGERIFGLPISEPLQVNGRTIQWFERARLEEWPEYAGTSYAVQGARAGVEFTKEIDFPSQTYFVSRPGLRYFPETGHGVRGPFLQFWEQNGSLDILGYPISDEVQELLPDDQVRTVQYFERGRIEHHPQQAGTPYEMQLGLLGRALYLNESKPHIIPPPRPTPVPMP